MGLFDVLRGLGTAQEFDRVPSFEQLNQDSGLVLYRTPLGGRGPGLLTLGEVRDRAWVFVDALPVGVQARESHERAIRLPVAGSTLTILVEDQGRVDYGPRLGEDKGLIGEVRLDGVELTGWSAVPLDVERIPELALAPAADPSASAGPGPVIAGSLISGPVISGASFALAEPADLFLDTAAWGKGLAWLNGFALGRYWRRGPQQTLYVPGPVTRAGRNELVVLELEAMADSRARFVDGLRLGHTEL
jgi:beta-galactosidase